MRFTCYCRKLRAHFCCASSLIVIHKQIYICNFNVYRWFAVLYDCVTATTSSCAKRSRLSQCIRHSLKVQINRQFFHFPCKMRTRSRTPLDTDRCNWYVLCSSSIDRMRLYLFRAKMKAFYFKF